MLLDPLEKQLDWPVKSTPLIARKLVSIMDFSVCHTLKLKTINIHDAKNIIYDNNLFFQDQTTIRVTHNQVLIISRVARQLLIPKAIHLKIRRYQIYPIILLTD